MGPLLEFLINMEVGSRQGVVEKEEEWERERDYEEEDMLREL